MRSRKTSVIFGGACFAFSSLAAADSAVSLGAEAGYRVDSLDWNVADTDGDPNVLSELTWSSLEIVQVKLNMDVTYRRIKLFGSAAYGKIDEGENQDSDYAANDRQAEFSRSNNRAGGEVADASVGIGYLFSGDTESGYQGYFMPMAGYSINRQDLRMTNGFQTIPATGSFAGLNSSYDAQWSGPWVGFSIGETDTGRALTLQLDVVFLKGDYEAEADWNLRPDFAHPKSFEHLADASGLTISLHSSYAFSNSWDFVMSLDYRDFRADAGVDRIYLADGTTITSPRFNEANWESMSFNVGLQWRPWR